MANETTPLLQTSDGHLLGAQNPEEEQSPTTCNSGVPTPFQWPVAYKYVIVALLSCMAFIISFTCSAVIPISDQIVEDITNGQSDKSAAVLLVTIWELGEASGPLLIAPLSEAYGRSPAFHLANCLFILGLVFSLHSQSMKALVFTRFLTGCAVASNVLNPAIVGDLFVTEQRGSPMSLVMLTQLAGTAVGPFVAAAVARSSGWQQILRISLVLAVVCELLFLILFRETYRLPKVQNSVDEPKETSRRVRSGTESLLPKVAILSAISRPFKVLRSSLVLLMLSALGSIISAFTFTTSTSLSNILQLQYGFDATETGSIFLALSGGALVGVAICKVLIDRIYRRLQHKKPWQEHCPEHRLPLVVISGFALSVLVALYGWAAEQRWPVGVLFIIVTLIGTAVFIGIVPLMAYIVDAFGRYSASALTAVLVTRCLMCTFLPLMVESLTKHLGFGFGFTILAILCLGLAPIPIIIMQYGASWRQNSEYTKDG